MPDQKLIVKKGQILRWEIKEWNCLKVLRRWIITIKTK